MLVQPSTQYQNFCPLGSATKNNISANFLNSDPIHNICWRQKLYFILQMLDLGLQHRDSCLHQQVQRQQLYHQAAFQAIQYLANQHHILQHKGWLHWDHHRYCLHDSRLIKGKILVPRYLVKTAIK